jgi:uncharacterized RmlC-like cupin family protein
MTEPRTPTTTMEVHFKLFGTDGVSLQSRELSKALTSRGWSVHACAADVPPATKGLKLPELSYQSPDAIDLRERVFPRVPTPAGSFPAAAGEALVKEITSRAEPIRQALEQYVDTHAIALLHVRNVMSLPYNLPATVALYGLAVDRPDLRFLMQHHDLYWEGPNAKTFRTPYREVSQLIERVMCPSLPNARHVLINPIAADALRDSSGIDGTVIPDGFDFDREVLAIDEVAFRRRLEILVGDTRPVDAGDLVVVMPARVALNKAIELAIQFVAGLERRRTGLENAPEGVGLKQRQFTAASRVILLLPQGEDLDDNRDYFERLLDYARQQQITVAYGGNIVVPDGRFRRDDSDHYPFYSTYQAVDLVCYPPEHEGFGNQAIEAVWARKPLAILEYPVFERFVRDHVPHYVSLGETAQLERLEDFGGLHQLAADILSRAVDGAIAVLTDQKMERTWTEENVPALRAFCGMDTVAAEYIRLYREMGVGAREPARTHGGLHHVPATELSVDTAQTLGMTRGEAISSTRTGASGIWMGETRIMPGARSGDHHHGASETAIYVLSGHPVFVFAEGGRERRIDASPGDYIFVPPFVPHREENASPDEPAVVILARSTQEAVVVNLPSLAAEVDEVRARDTP